jgi:hypothetical protein
MRGPVRYRRADKRRTKPNDMRSPSFIWAAEQSCQPWTSTVKSPRRAHHKRVLPVAVVKPCGTETTVRKGRPPQSSAGEGLVREEMSVNNRGSILFDGKQPVISGDETQCCQAKAGLGFSIVSPYFTNTCKNRRTGAGSAFQP